MNEAGLTAYPTHHRWWMLLSAFLVVAALGLVGAGTATGVEPAPNATLNPNHVNATNPGFTSGTCPANPDNSNTFGWHFVLQGSDTTFNSISATFLSAGVITDFVSTPTAKHAFVFTPTEDTLLGATANVTGPDPDFNLSHVCSGSGTTPPPDDGTPPPDGGEAPTGQEQAPTAAPSPQAVAAQPQFTG